MNDYIEENEYVTFNNGFDEAYDKERALKEGIEEGKKESTKDIAIELLKQNIDIKIISEATKIPIDELRKLNNN